MSEIRDYASPLDFAKAECKKSGETVVVWERTTASGRVDSVFTLGPFERQYMETYGWKRVAVVYPDK